MTPNGDQLKPRRAADWVMRFLWTLILITLLALVVVLAKGSL